MKLSGKHLLSSMCTFLLHLFHTGLLAGGSEIDATDMPTEMTATGTECRTTEGIPCVFPFSSGNRLYHECTWESAFKTRGPIWPGGNGRAWCGTTEKVDDLVEVQWQFGHWGDCGRGCTISGGYITIF